MTVQNTSFLWIILSMACFGVIHSLLAAKKVKTLIERRIGKIYHRFYRLFFNLFAAVSLLPILTIVALLPDKELYTIPIPWVVITLALQVIAGGGLLLGVHQTGASSFTGILQLFSSREKPETSHLVVHGFYRVVRHPLYSFSLVILWLMPLMTSNILAFNIGATLYLTIGSFFEERKLVEEFGEAYIKYRQRTPMFFPFQIHKR